MQPPGWTLQISLLLKIVSCYLHEPCSIPQNCHGSESDERRDLGFKYKTKEVYEGVGLGEGEKHSPGLYQRQSWDQETFLK